MSEKIIHYGVTGTRQQEITMRDVMAGLEDIVTMLSYDPWPGDFEIIAVHSPHEDSSQPKETVVARNQPKPPQRADVISWEERRALRLSA